MISESNGQTTVLRPKRGVWVTRYGFYLAAIGGAFGLGNLWRFPYVVVENGGGAFVLLYVFLAFLLGLPLLISELLLGKKTKLSTIKALERLNFNELVSSRLNWITGRLSLFLCSLVLAYYAVISGWVMFFFMRFLLMGVESNSTTMQTLLSSGGLQVGLTGLHLALAATIIIKGFEEGFERWIGFMMPAFVVLLLFLIYKSVSLPGAGVALRFLLYPDFSKLSLSSLGQAVGHVCFTLSIGFGTMVTFGSYMKERTKVSTSGFRVTAMDTIISLLAGLLIFPIYMSSLDQQVSGPETLFLTVPRFFSQIEGGRFYAVAFFLCLYLAALGATIGLMESVTANLIDKWRFSRFKASSVCALLCFGFGVFPAMASTVFQEVHLGGKNLLVILDSAIINWFLPLAALGISLAVIRGLKKSDIVPEFEDPSQVNSIRLFRDWNIVLRWLAPVTIGLALLLQALDLLI